MSSWSAAAVLIAVTGWGGIAPPLEPTVELEVVECPSLDREVLHRITGIELGGTAVAARIREATTRVRVRCDTSSVEIRVSDAVTNKRVERTIDSAALGRGTDERIIALAVAELVSASWLELRIEPDPPPPPPRDPAPDITDDVRARALSVAESTGVEPARPRPRWVAGASVGLRWLPPARIHLIAARAELRRRLGSVFGVLFGVEAMGGRAAVDAGDVRIAALAPALGGYVHVEHGSVAIDSGLGIRGGWVVLEGRNPTRGARPLRHDTGWFEPYVEATVMGHVHPRLTLVSVVDAGWIVVGAGGEENGVEVIRFGGPTLGARVGLAARF